MPAPLRLTTFQGLRPRTNPRLIGDSAAQVASNCNLQNGVLSPVKRPANVYVPSKPLPVVSMFKAVDGGSSAWMTWPYDVDAVKMPMPAGVAARFAWTGDGEPRWGKYANITNGGGNDYPSQYYALGIPNPTAKPTATPSGGTTNTVTRFYCYTFFSQDGEESGPSPASDAASGYTDATWAIANMQAFPANSGTGTAAHSAGVTTFTNAASAATWLRAGDEVVIDGDTLVVSETPAADSFKVPGDYSAATSWARKAPWNTTNMKRRLYRTAGTAAAYQLVHDDVGTSYNDNLSDSAIMGDELISDGWKPPPAGLKGLIVTASGSLAGFMNGEIRLSEPYQGHAWPDAYIYRTAPDIVAIAPMGSAIGVGTEGVPYVLIGSDPAAMASVPANSPYPCLSKRSMVSDGGGVIYSSAAGLIRLDQSAQPTVFSEPWFDPKAWDKKVPSSIVCAVAPGRLYAAYQADGRRGVMVFDMAIGELVENSVEAVDIYVDEATAEAYISDTDGISAMLGGEYTAQLVWRSKEFVLPKPENYGAAKVRFSAAIDEELADSIIAEIAAAIAFNETILATGDLGGQFNYSGYNTRRWNGSMMRVVPELPPSNTVTFTLFADGAERYTKVLTSDAPFRLPSGYLAGRVSVQVSSACEITGIEMAGNMIELQRV